VRNEGNPSPLFSNFVLSYRSPWFLFPPGGQAILTFSNYPPKLLLFLCVTFFQHFSSPFLSWIRSVLRLFPPGCGKLRRFIISYYADDRCFLLRSPDLRYLTLPPQPLNPLKSIQPDSATSTLRKGPFIFPFVFPFTPLVGLPLAFCFFFLQ